MKVTVDVKNAQATEETRRSDMVAKGMMDLQKEAIIFPTKLLFTSNHKKTTFIPRIYVPPLLNAP
jgi:hypothetical protein